MTEQTMREHHSDGACLPIPLQRLVKTLQPLVAHPLDEATLLDRVRPALADLVSHDDWLPDACAQPDPVHYRQYALYVEPQGRFSIVSFVWGPGQATPVHDHTVWGLIGMLRGGEYTQGYRIQAGVGLVPEGDAIRLSPGDVEAVSPRLGDIHRVSNAFDDRVSISIHVYGGDIGRIARSTYAADGQPRRFVSSYSPWGLPVSAGADLS
jgi:3-mercaptopropionate dioxygenase